MKAVARCRGSEQCNSGGQVKALMVELLGLGNAVFLRGSNGCVIESCNWWDNDSFKPALFVGFVLIFPRISLPSTNRGNSMLSARMLATYISSFVVLAIVGCDRSGTAGNAPPQFANNKYGSSASSFGGQQFLRAARTR